jgi:hypothetical protein
VKEKRKKEGREVRKRVPPPHATTAGANLCLRQTKKDQYYANKIECYNDVEETIQPEKGSHNNWSQLVDSSRRRPENCT